MYKISCNTDRAFFYNIFLKLILKLLSFFMCESHDSNCIPFKNRVVFFVTFHWSEQKCTWMKYRHNSLHSDQSSIKSRPCSPPFLKWLLMLKRKLIWKFPTFYIQRSVLAFKEKRMHLAQMNKVPGTLLTMQTSVCVPSMAKNNTEECKSSLLQYK